MGLINFIKGKKKKKKKDKPSHTPQPNTQQGTLNDPFSDFTNLTDNSFGSFDNDPFSGLGDDIFNTQQISVGAKKEQKQKREPHPIVTFLRKSRDTFEKISERTKILLKGKPPVAVFRTYSDIVVFHEDKGIKVIINGYEHAHYSEWDLKGKKWKKITVKEVLDNEYTGDMVQGRGFLLTRFLMPKAYLQGKLLYYDVQVYVGEFQGSLTKPIKVGKRYKRGGRVGINANLLVVIREYSIVNQGGRLARKEHILYTGGKLSDDLIEFIREEKKKKSRKSKDKYKPPELTPLEGTGETDEIVIDKEEAQEESTGLPGDNMFGNLGGDLFKDFGSSSSQSDDPFSDLF